MIYNKYYEDEKIEIGDLISYKRIEDKVIKSKESHYIEPDVRIIGVCDKVLEDNTISVKSVGICDINVINLICIGDKLTASERPGKARAIKYGEDETNFDIRSIGKVIGLYNSYDKVKVILDIE